MFKIILIALGFLAVMNVSIRLLYPFLTARHDDRLLQQRFDRLCERNAAIAGKPSNVESEIMSQGKKF
jgi:hypothetical protein